MEVARALHKALIEKGKTLACAESCTGGKIGATLTALPDASLYFLGSCVTYSNAWKQMFLHVAPNTLRVHGSVSRETANEMLLGLMKGADADYGIAVTGLAGPSGGTEEKPVGTVYIAIGKHGGKPHVTHHLLSGSREEITDQVTALALSQLLELL